MASALLRLLALVALVIMPFGMTATPAIAGPAHHSMAMANHSMTMAGHCDEQPDEDHAPARKLMDCTAACTALPAAAAPELAPMLKPTAPRTIAVAAPFHGIVLEIATPPPRRG